MPWTGVGARATPIKIQRIMTEFASFKKDACRTGGAEGADEAFMRGARKQEVYLPNQGFRGHAGIWDYTEKQLEFADFILTFAFPGHIKKFTTRAMFRRNVFQVLGLCDSEAGAKPSKFLLCWTPDGATSKDEYELGVTGGTGIAINIVSMFDVPVYNLQRKDHRREILDYIADRKSA